MTAIHTTKNIEAFSRVRTEISTKLVVELVHGRTGLIKRRLVFGNLIVDSGLDAVGATGTTLDDIVSHLAVGTDDTPPGPTDIELGNEIGRTNSDGGFGDELVRESGVWSEFWKSRVFSEGEANGDLKELGVFTGASGSMFNRALFRDENGVPTTITKTSEDVLRVLVGVRVWVDLDDVILSGVTISGESYDVYSGTVSRVDFWTGTTSIRIPSRFGFWGQQTSTNTFGSIRADEPQGLPTNRNENTTGGTSDNVANVINRAAYVDGSSKREYEAQWGPARANFPGGVGRIGYRLHGSSGAQAEYMIAFDPPLPKTEDDRLIIQAEFPFGRYTS
jgi:hypothetical protein